MATSSHKVQHFYFYDLQLCVGQLLEGESGPSWGSEPSMRARVVTFVREQVQALSWRSRLHCTIR